MRRSRIDLRPLAAALFLPVWACFSASAAEAPKNEFKNYDAGEVLIVDHATGYFGIKTEDAAGNEVKTAFKADLAKTQVLSASNEDMLFTDIAVGDSVDVITRALPSGAEEVVEIDIYGKQPKADS